MYTRHTSPEDPFDAYRERVRANDVVLMDLGLAFFASERAFERAEHALTTAEEAISQLQKGS